MTFVLTYFGRNAYKKNKAFVWDGECEEAFRKLKEICISTPILAYADFLKPFKLHTDVCTLGLGAIPYQNQDWVDCIIGYATRCHSKTECKYPSSQTKILGLKVHNYGALPWVPLQQQFCCIHGQ